MLHPLGSGLDTTADWAAVPRMMGDDRSEVNFIEEAGSRKPDEAVAQRSVGGGDNPNQLTVRLLREYRSSGNTLPVIVPLRSDVLVCPERQLRRPLPKTQANGAIEGESFTVPENSYPPP